jgi:hypothetical protein
MACIPGQNRQSGCVVGPLDPEPFIQEVQTHQGCALRAAWKSGRRHVTAEDDAITQRDEMTGRFIG